MERNAEYSFGKRPILGRKDACRNEPVMVKYNETIMSGRSLELDTITALDFAVLDGIQSVCRSAFLDWLMPLVTLLAEGGMLPIAAAVILLLHPKTRKAGLALAIGLLLMNVVVNIGLKPLVARPRPFVQNPSVELLVAKLTSYSFPSGHTACAFMTAYVLAYFYPKAKGYWWILAAAVGFSRLYLYVHFPSDVLAGAVCGILCGMAGVVFGKWIFHQLIKNKGEY